ncbi:sugar ABC transporter permease [Ponticoccus sp. SC2-23]|uniref:sugar ABC transporter permease n=1 Tax=Alexandriicola marinus TaxID=2081710 RepID=UPI000FD87D9C|nr:sugar ABC transporter permease [Alexandriicola marinus]MBM1222415.1 sugar ABC transporter permease [Ponticoccus sp. SC6-9]MBM1224528.1 sugar ABC transporter permease [Ponticoccus sp. SC6-15]MBM1229692.1 sugar ABC transporter permease [Ponticoccus sp. SC6-38]MBM1233494.1 sugar ABC transporter permease [Ponticoccus sp. SC6-45]MBM1236556.1 sugar ABC transporter permease [Ponticoccus sp. SC6-49]MBM1244600.1 sugar ABC transporter permease [Ponticoccus sp. SC2-64]MBM1247018.1 sugar ABC transpor
MADISEAASASGTKRGVLATLELDARLLGMLVAFLAIVLIFTVWTGGTFIQPRNVFNISVQTVPVAIMACGMVFVIVTRHIDLSVGSMLAMCSAVMAMSQAYWLPSLFGLEYGNPMVLVLTILIGFTSGILMGAATGWLVGYQQIPSFIVTLGGLFIWRNVNWFTTNGQSVSLTDPNLLMFGGTEGVLGAPASYAVGIAASVVAVLTMMAARKNKIGHGFVVKPMWAEGTMMAIIVATIMLFVHWLSLYEIPAGKLRRMFEARGETVPEGYTAMHGLPISVLILILVAVVMTVVARKTRFGRYIFAAGGNPDAAELSGVDTKWLTVKVFALMGFLCGLAALIAQARLQSHGNDIGMLEELRVIAAAVIGGTALAGGVGTIYGAVLGALIMQSLQSGMAMVGVDTPFQNIIVGLVLIVAVWVDIIYRKRMGISK